MQCPALSHLDLNCTRIFADGAETERFAVVLAQCTSLPALSPLNLSHTINKYDTGIRVVEALVARCSLNLGDNDIGAGGAESLAGVLGQCAGLTEGEGMRVGATGPNPRARGIHNGGPGTGRCLWHGREVRCRHGGILASPLYSLGC